VDSKLVTKRIQWFDVDKVKILDLKQIKRTQSDLKMIKFNMKWMQWSQSGYGVNKVDLKWI